MTPDSSPTRSASSAAGGRAAAASELAASPLPERPRLRALEAFVAEARGRRMIGLRDPTGFSEAVLAFPLELLPLLEAMDGTRTIFDLQVAETRRQGRIVLASEIEDLVRALDEHLFLLSPRFQAVQARVEAAFRRSPTRPAFHAGRAYPSDPQALRAWLDSFFTHPDGPGAVGAAPSPPPAPEQGRNARSPDGEEVGSPSRAGATAPVPAAPLAGILAPHIDFQRGGPTYAWAYRALAEAEPADLYVVLGVPHQGLEGTAAVTVKPYETPFGPLEVDRDFVEGLRRRSGLDLFQSELQHRAEHSIEFEAVFLRYLFGDDRDIRIVPVLASFAHEALARGQRPADDPDAQRLIAALGETIAAYPGRVCLVGGVDLAHVGPQFGDPAPVTAPTLSWLETEDRQMLAAVEAGDPEAFFDTVAKDGDRRRVCGLTAIYTFLSVLQRPGRVLKYHQAADPQNTVTFASAAF